MRDPWSSGMMVARSARDAAPRQQAEVTTMYPYQPLSGRDAAAKRDQLWSTILDYRHAAGLKLTADDMQERTRAEVARSILLKEAGLHAGPSLLLRELRQWMGAALVRVGERLQGATTAGVPTSPISSAPAPMSS
jgi:hypothetical protein